MKTLNVDGVGAMELSVLEQSQLCGGNAIIKGVRCLAEVLGIFELADAFVEGFKEGFKEGYQEQQGKK